MTAVISVCDELAQTDNCNLKQPSIPVIRDVIKLIDDTSDRNIHLHKRRISSRTKK